MAITARDVDDDAALVRAVQDGDREAFAALYRRHYGAVRRACARRLRSVADADEVAQAAFVRAFERIHQCGGERRFGGWVQVIAHRMCIDLLRARARTTPHEEPVAADAAVGPNAPEDAILREQAARDIRLALASLPERQRDVVIARDVEERRPPEIAAALGLTLGAVDSLLLRARRKLAVAYRAAAGEQGAASTLSTTALAGGAAAAAPGGLVRAAGALADLVRDTLVHTTATAPAAPGVPSGLRRTAAAVAAAVGLATGGAGTAPEPPAPPPAARVVLPAAPVPIPSLPPLPLLATPPGPLQVLGPALPPAVPVPANPGGGAGQAPPAVAPVPAPSPREAAGALDDALGRVLGAVPVDAGGASVPVG